MQKAGTFDRPGPTSTWTHPRGPVCYFIALALIGSRYLLSPFISHLCGPPLVTVGSAIAVPVFLVHRIRSAYPIPSLLDFIYVLNAPYPYFSSFGEFIHSLSFANDLKLELGLPSNVVARGQPHCCPP